jgi:hypothetical protein
MAKFKRFPICLHCSKWKDTSPFKFFFHKRMSSQFFLKKRTTTTDNLTSKKLVFKKRFVYQQLDFKSRYILQQSIFASQRHNSDDISTQGSKLVYPPGTTTCSNANNQPVQWVLTSKHDNLSPCEMWKSWPSVCCHRFNLETISCPTLESLKLTSRPCIVKLT